MSDLIFMFMCACVCMYVCVYVCVKVWSEERSKLEDERKSLQDKVQELTSSQEEAKARATELLQRASDAEARATEMEFEVARFQKQSEENPQGRGEEGKSRHQNPVKPRVAHLAQAPLLPLLFIYFYFYFYFLFIILLLLLLLLFYQVMDRERIRWHVQLNLSQHFSLQVNFFSNDTNLLYYKRVWSTLG